MITSPNLPVHICKEIQADEVYNKHAGTELLGVSISLRWGRVGEGGEGWGRVSFNRHM